MSNQNLCRDKVNQAIIKARRNNETCVTLDISIPLNIAKELSNKGYNVIVFEAKNWVPCTKIDISSNATGQIKFTKDPIDVGKLHF